MSEVNQIKVEDQEKTTEDNGEGAIEDFEESTIKDEENNSVAEDRDGVLEQWNLTMESYRHI